MLLSKVITNKVDNIYDSS